MHSFLKRLAGFSVGSIVGALISVIQVPLMTRLLTQGDYGIYSFFKVLLMQIPVFLCIGMDQAFVREYHVFAEKKWAFQEAIWLPLLVAGLFFLATILAAQPLAIWIFDRAQDAPLVIWGGAWCLLGLVERFLFLLVRMEERALVYSKMAITIKLAVFATTLLFLLLGWRSYASAIFGLVWGNLAIDLLFLVRYRAYFDFRGFRPDRKVFLRMLVFALPLILSVGLNSLLNSLDNLALHRYAGEEDLGIYNAALGMVSLFSLVSTSFTNFWLPTALRWQADGKSQRHFALISEGLVFLMSLLFFALLPASLLLEWILGPAYRAAGSILGLLSLRPILSLISETTVLGLLFARKTAYNLPISLLTFLPGLLVNILLTPKWGYLGAALASAASSLVFYGARTYFSAKSGFRLPQKKQAWVFSLLFLAAALWAWEAPWRGLAALVLFGLTLFVQWPTLLELKTLKTQPQDWDFN